MPLAGGCGMFDRPELLGLLALAPIAAIPSILAMRAGLRVPGRIAAKSVAVVAALDQSRSMAPDQQDWMRRQVEKLKAAMSPNGHLGNGADAGATNIAGALTAAESLFPADADKRIVLLSDGNETEDSALAELPTMLEDGVRIYAVAPPPSATERIAVTNFESPDTARSDQRFAFRIDIDSESHSPVTATLKLYRDDTPVGAELITLKPGLNRFELPYRIDRPGAYLMSAEVAVAPPRVALN